MALHHFGNLGETFLVRHFVAAGYLVIQSSQLSRDGMPPCHSYPPELFS